jgi:hypothetical protein
MSIHLWLEDFNDPPPAAETLALPEPEPEPEPTVDLRLEGWTEGFMTACRAMGQISVPPSLTADLIRRIEAMQSHLQQVADNAATQMAGLLLDLLTQALPEDWPDPVRDRLAELVDAVRPAFALEPRFHLQTPAPAVLGLTDIPSLVRAIDAVQDTDWPITLRWTHTQAAQDMLPAIQAALR